MDSILKIIEIVIVAAFFIMLYRRFYNKPQIKAVKVKVPTARQIRRAKRRARRLRKIRRRFRIPYVGKTKIIRYDKKLPYIESIWNEIEPQK